MELACYPDSKLGTEVEGRFGKGSAIRRSDWNGCDLETSRGVSQAITLLKRHRPVHLWIACECGPFCPWQRMNKAQPQQVKAVEEKQGKAVQQYTGAIQVAEVARSQGTQVHWEMSERSDAWMLPLVQGFLQKFHFGRVTTHGCCVGLRTVDGRLPLCKGWTVASSNPSILQHMNLRCQKNHMHGECRGRSASASARYTDIFARKVVDCMREPEVWSLVVQELQQKEEEGNREQGNQDEGSETNSKHNTHAAEQQLPSPAPAVIAENKSNTAASQHNGTTRSQESKSMEFEGENLLGPHTLGAGDGDRQGGVFEDTFPAEAGEDEQLQPEPEHNPEQQQRKHDLQQKLLHIHRVTGHDSFISIARALESRGASDELIAIAKGMTCPTCAERKRPQPRRHASLETLPRKWERIQVDTGDWDHPIHRTKHRFVLFVDEGSKFRAGQVYKGAPRKMGSWENLKTSYEQLWLPVHGTPALLRVDPAGPWSNAQADTYFAERGVELQPIPAEAHWQIGSVENAIKEH